MARGANDQKALSIYNVFLVSLQADYAFVLIQRYLQIQVSNKRHDRIFANLHEVETVISTMSQLRQNTLTDVTEQCNQCLVTIELNEITWSNHDHKCSEAPEEWERFNTRCFMMCCSSSMPELFNLQFSFSVPGCFQAHDLYRCDSKRYACCNQCSTDWWSRSRIPVCVYLRSIESLF